MQNFATVIVVLTILIGLLAAADKFKMPNPVLLVVAGLGIGFIPSIPAITLDPEVVFLIFLPPLLYDAASNTSWHDFKSEFKVIATLAIVLVIFTTGAVAVASYMLIPGFTWPLAFVLGAIVSPPDAVAATSITKGLGLSRKVITILEGESLVNDASALIAYRFAIAAIGTGSFVLWQAGLSFLLVVIGGIVTGVAMGYFFVVIHKRILNNSIISTSLSLLTPFIAYLAAEYIHASGVLSIVSAGLVISWRAPEVFSYQTRIRHRAVWDTLIFLLNGFIFILIGLQLRAILADLEEYSVYELAMYGLLVSVVTIAVRILWVFGVAFQRSGGRQGASTVDANTWKNVVVIAWTGTRGVVSLATALALPLTIGGSLFPHRSLILFLAFVVIFVTLVIQGLSLPLLVRWLNIKPQDFPDQDERALRLSVANSVLNFIDQDLDDQIDEATRNQIRQQYIEIIASLTQEEKTTATDKISIPEWSPVHGLLKAQSEINKFQRKLLLDYHQSGNFNHATIRRMEQKLDLEELLFHRGKKKKR
jgi:CPA1 family monovalent cation:H+ antiporter